MSLILRALDLHLPPFVKRRGLARLAVVTADAFGAAPPDLKGLPHERALERYARFTSDEAERALEEGRAKQVEGRLREGARAMGEELRRALRVSSREEALTAARLLYRAVGIDFRAGLDGEVVVRRCFFSDFYGPEVCEVIAALDRGVLEGLTGGQLSFRRRITEGAECCLARLDWAEDR